MGRYPHVVPHGLMFHHFHDERHPKVQGSLSSDLLESLLDYVGTERILSPAEWIARVEDATLDSQHLCLTFDDALLCQFDIALPVLERRGLRAFWFVYSSVFEGQWAKLEIYRLFRARFGAIDDFYELFFSQVAEELAAVEERDIEALRRRFTFYSTNDIKFRLVRDKFLSKEQYEAKMDRLIVESGSTFEEISKNVWLTDSHLRYLADHGHEVGLHSYSHPLLLADLSPEDQRSEYCRNLAHIQKVCGRPPLSMAHPSNSYNDATVGILEELGIRCGFRANMSPDGKGKVLNPSPLEIAREDHSNVVRMMPVHP